MADKNEKVAQHTEADSIWDEIKSLPIDVYAVQGQRVDQYVKKIDVPGSQLYIKISSSAVLPALEMSLANTQWTRGKKYTVDVGDGFIVVKRHDDPALKVQEALEKMKKNAK